MTASPSVSLVICTYNREELLVQSIACALQQDYENMEIVVIDQTEKHNDETAAYLDSVKSKIRYIFSSQPSLTRARNTAIDNTDTDIIIFIDDDVVLEPGFVSSHVAAHNKYDVVQGRVVEEGAKVGDKPHWVNRWIKFSGTNNCTREGKTNVVTGCNFSLKRSVVEKIGYFDEKFSRLALREDSDYGLRCYKSGVKMGFSPDAGLLHLSSSSGGVDTGIGNMFFNKNYYFNDMYFARKHFSRLACEIYRFRMYRRGCKAVRKLIDAGIDELD